MDTNAITVWVVIDREESDTADAVKYVGRSLEHVEQWFDEVGVPNQDRDDRFNVEEWVM